VWSETVLNQSESKQLSETKPAMPKSFFDLQATNINGEIVPMERYRGKVLLVVNTASKCGFTSQYEGLEQLYQKYKEKNFVVLGFPSNDFRNQEPGTNEEIQRFCKLKYGVTFPLFQRNPVIGENKQPIYRFLTDDGDFTGDVGWNFVKFIVGKDGKVHDRFSSLTKPTSTKVIQAIEKLL
jgi:glutathione peroxidase